MMAHMVFSVCVGLPTHGEKQITRILLDNVSRTNTQDESVIIIIIISY